MGQGHPVFVIAEIGYNFNTLDEGLASIDAALDAGADAVKFQTFRAATVVSRNAAFPPEAGDTNQFAEFSRYELSADAHAALFAHARRRGGIVFSTPSYYDDVELLEPLDPPVYKVGSDDLTNLPFLTHVASKKKPLIFSTGMATLAEVDEALRAVRAAGNEDVLILHCVSNYPIRDVGTLNLNAIATMRREFDVPVGFSDHTTSTTAAIAAVALGACVVERHFTLDKALDAPDAFFSADAADLRALVAAIREAEAMLGSGIKQPAGSEAQMRVETRKSVIARTAIPAGDPISQDHLIVKRPGTGIPPKLMDQVVGRRARRAIAADQVITWDDVE